MEHAKELVAIATDMARMMPNACGDWAARILGVVDSMNGVNTSHTPSDTLPWITRKVRKGTDEHRAYLRARFPTNGGAPSQFNFDGHNWRYYVTSFDDIGEYDVIQRPNSADASVPA